MSFFRRLTIALMILAFAIHPAFVDVLKAADINGTICSQQYPTMPSNYKGFSQPTNKNITALTPEQQTEAEGWLNAKPAYVKIQGGSGSDSSSGKTYLYYDAAGNLLGSKTVRKNNSGKSNIVSETIRWKDKSGKTLSIINNITKSTYKSINGTRQLMSETIKKTIIRPDGSSEKTTTVKTYTRDSSGKCTGMTQTKTGTQVLVDASGKATTYNLTNYSAEIKYDSQKGWYVASESYDWEEGTPTVIPGTKLTPEQQAEAEGYLGVKPASVKVEGDKSLYYDDKGNLLGSKTVQRSQPAGSDTVTETVTWADKAGKTLISTKTVTKSTYKTINGTRQLMSETIDTTITRPDGSSEKTTAVRTYNRDASGKCTGVTQTKTGTQVMVGANGGTTTYNLKNYAATFKYDDKNGWYLESESYDWVEGGSTVIPGSVQGQAASLYRDILGREGTAAEIAARAKQIADGMSLETLAKEFFNSPEFQKKSTTEKIAALYRIILGRSPGSGETKGWDDMYDKGTSLSEIANLIITHPGKEFANKPADFKDNVLNKLKIVDATKGDVNKGWIKALGTLPADDAAARISAYVKDDATAKEIATALSKLDPSITARILGSAKVSATIGAKVLAGIDAAQAAKILAYTAYSLSGGNYAVLPPSIATDKAIAMLMAMDVSKAAAILGAFGTAPLDTFNAQSATAIINGLAVDKVAQLISNIPNIASGNGSAAAAAVLAKLDLAKVTSIMLSGNMSVEIAAKIFAAMNPVRAGLVLVPLNTDKGAQIIAAMPADIAGKILFAQDPNSPDPAVNNMKILYILERLSPDIAAKIINAYCAANSQALPARVEQLFRKEVPAVSALIFASSNMSVDNAARIISAIKAQGFSDKANSILSAIDGVNRVKADQIREKMGSNVPLTAESKAAYLYKNILGRNGSAAEIAARAKQITDGMSLETLAKEFFNSPEFRKKSTTEKIAALYRIILGRSPGSGETKGWDDMYDKGTSLSEIANLIITHPYKEFANKPADFKDYVLNKLKIVDTTKGDGNI